METDDETTETPGDEAWKEHTSSFDRVQSVALTVAEPRPASWIADEALVAENTARRHLQRLVELNVLTADAEGGATTYFPDPVYVRTREVRALLEEHDQDSLAALATELKSDIENWQAEFDASSPEQVRKQTAKDSFSAEDSRERRHVASDWEHTRYRLSLIEDALERYGEFTNHPAPA
ncbi:DUF7342 family protein [Natronoarchaeum rubrum]|uniref:DUF7342 family protein n=1 Tax=Natronoarchaeum rubrum TaxID=755311 RepID=UPI0021123149|nr:ArsR family transcriptional regulator [Natronoarchaeum rubrum]